MANDVWLTEWNYQVKTKLERSKERKPTNTWASWRLTPSNKWRWKTKFRKNILEGINTWAVLIGRYSGPFVKWIREELKQMDQRTKKLMTMHKALYPRDDVGRHFVSRKESGRRVASIENNVDASIQRLEDYIEKHEGGLIKAIKNDTDNTLTNWMTITRKQRWEENNSMCTLND